MKIAFVFGVFFPQPGGAQVQAHNFANKLVEFGEQVDCYIYRKTNVKNNNYNIFKLNYFITSFVYFFHYYFEINLIFILKFYLKKIILKKKYNVWHFNFLNYKSLLIINALKDLDQKIVVTFQGIDIQIKKDINYGYRLNKKYDKLLKLSLNKIDLFTSISKNIKEDLLELKVDKSKIFIISNSVELEKFTNTKINKKIDNKIKLITVARYAELKKGFDILDDILKKLIENKILFEWKIIGKNSNELLKKKIVKINKSFFRLYENIENNYEKYYPNSKLIEHYKSSDIYINLSRIESFGITLVEALASELPVISFDTKGGNEIVIDNYNGNLLRNNDTEGFVKKIKYYFDNKTKIEEMKLNCIKSIQNYKLDKNTKEILEIYNKNIIKDNI